MLVKVGPNKNWSLILLTELNKELMNFASKVLILKVLNTVYKFYQRCIKQNGGFPSFSRHDH